MIYCKDQDFETGISSENNMWIISILETILSPFLRMDFKKKLALVFSDDQDISGSLKQANSGTVLQAEI